MVKAMVFKLFFNAGYLVFSEHDIIKRNRLGNIEKIKVADVIAYDGNNTSETSLSVVVEVETKPTINHNKELMEFYEDRTLYIIDVRKISDNLLEMEKQLKHILGL